MNKDKFHRAFGVYSIITIDNALVVIMKMVDRISIGLIYLGVVWKMVNF